MHKKLAILTAVLFAPGALAQSGGANLGSGSFYAFISGNGTLFQAMSKGALPCTINGSSCRSGLGQYSINFARDISACSYMVQMDSNARVSWAKNSGAANRIDVGVLDPILDGYIDDDFRITVIC